MVEALPATPPPMGLAGLGYGYRPSRALYWLIALIIAAAALVTVAAQHPDADGVPVARRAVLDTTPPRFEYCSFGEATALTLRIAVPLINNLGQGTCVVNTQTAAGSVFTIGSWVLQAIAWILGALVVAATATAIRRTT